MSDQYQQAVDRHTPLLNIRRVSSLEDVLRTFVRQFRNIVDMDALDDFFDVYQVEIGCRLQSFPHDILARGRFEGA
jgi:hypothetical protein